MTIDLEQFHQVFFEESLDRAAHSIKGGSGTFGFTEVSDFTHLMETLLDEVRDGLRSLTRELVDALLKSCDCLRNWFDCLQAKRALSDEMSKPLVEIFQNMLKGDSNSAKIYIY